MTRLFNSMRDNKGKSVLIAAAGALALALVGGAIAARGRKDPLAE